MLRRGGSDALLLGASSSILLLLLVLVPIVSPSPSPNLVLTSILCKSCPVAREEGVNHAVTSPGPLLRSLFRPLRGGSDDTAVNDVGIEGTKPTRRRLKIALEGNIAAGKSTLLRLLEDDVDYVAVPEPLAKWQQVYHEPIGMIAAMVAANAGEEATGTGSQGGNLLELFYKDPQRFLRYQYSETGTFGEGDTPRFGILMMMCGGRWGYTFQTYAFLSRMMAQLQPAEAEVSEGRHSRASLQSNASSVVFYERSVFSDRYIFAENCAETGLFNKVEWGIYQDWHEWLLGAFSNLKLDAIVYLRTTPDTCLKRLQKRARSEEAGVPLEYLKQIHHRHERWLRDRPADFHPAPQVVDTPILTLDCDADMTLHPEMKDQLREQVRAFIAKLRASDTTEA